jgi:hypothetical protein
VTSGLGFYVISVLTHGVRWIGYLDEPTFVAFVAFVISFPAAMLMVFVEWPKAKKFTRKSNGGMWQHCLISIFAASVIPFIIEGIGLAVDKQESGLRSLEWVGILYIVPVFMLGGLFSASVWWVIVVRYGRLTQPNNH